MPTSPPSTSRIGGADLKFDHLGYLVADLARAASRLGRGGFPLTERVRLDGPGGEWSGGEQQVASLADGYLEVQQLVDSERSHVLTSRADSAPSVAVLAWLSDDLDADLTLFRAADVPLSPAADWSRTTPEGLARFRFAAVLDDGGPLRVLVQHLDPDLTRRSIHAPDGVLRVHGVRRAGDDRIRPLDASDVASAVEMLQDARPITSVVLDCTGPKTCTHLAESGWTMKGSLCRSSEDLGADLELRWS